MGSVRYPLFAMILTWGLLLLGSESKTHSGDVQVLKELKQGLEPGSVNPGSCVSSWDFTLDPCDNLLSEKFTCGFRCDVVVSGLSRVTELALDQAGYAGSLNNLTWNLPYLQTLDISHNYFSGQIPDSFSNLTRLSRLSLSSNSFSGEIPASLGTLSNLEKLYLDNNNLRGTIPQGFANLKTLELQSNNLNTRLSNLASLGTLEYLDLSDNAVSGEFPPSLPFSLVQISIRNNNLSGVLTRKSFEKLTRLQVVDLSSNRMSGSVPSLLFELPSLQQLTLSFNEFTNVEAPYKGVESRSGLVAVDLSNNRLRGWLPSFMAAMPRLSSLSLENNELTGRIPTGLGVKTVFPGKGVAALERLLLGGNYLVGGIPRPLLALKRDSANVSLGDNCLYRCPRSFFFCQGPQQKSLVLCNRFTPPSSP
ncbi:probable LRR receptor-like serine/threonine-protein kinase At4g36180 [Cajanus cajan]|uniref:LRR receptor-like serine/threonine-protein kinase At4g36180 family n=1 Tax=Cajanus cajan TaxID=3821 RepID=A0A151TIM5_CAJCA|nr:probable LRR receptor-like serine/threonine-protein kinase At4g36180 [Cajanus cajan]KYP66901.1 putative LRR receptor-like serine/threonine-protein kinase At4g36180 family [Cajanus cajan]